MKGLEKSTDNYAHDQKHICQRKYITIERFRIVEHSSGKCMRLRV